MSTFLKLSKRIINTRQISEITYFEPNKYHIFFSHSTGGGLVFIGSGGTSFNTDQFEICKEKNLADYNIITNWINNQNNS